MPRFQPPSPPYVGPASYAGGEGNKPIRRVVIHSTVSPCEPGGARNIAAYFRGGSAGGSAHYVVDPSEVVQVVYDSRVAYHAPPNEHSLGIEMCDMPGPTPPATSRRKARETWRWNKPNQIDMLDRTARLTAQLCLAYNVPIRYRSAVALRLGLRGITTHAEVSAAFRQSSHWDPGFWPRRDFMRRVRKHAQTLRGRRK